MSSSNIQREGFWDGNTVGYGEYEWARLLQALFLDGVDCDTSGDLTLAVSSLGTSIKVATGYILQLGRYREFVTETTLTPSAASQTVYRVVIKTDLNAKTTTLYLKAGSSGAAPSLTDSSTVKERSLAQFVWSGSSVSGLVDERADESLCGALRPKNNTGIADLLTSMNSQFQTLYDSLTSQTGVRAIYYQAAEPSGVAAGTIWV